jgi:hypothetical protein
MPVISARFFIGRDYEHKTCRQLALPKRFALAAALVAGAVLASQKRMNALRALLLMAIGVAKGPSAPAAPTLASAASFAVLSGASVTNIGATTITGDLGVSPDLAITGFPPGVVKGGAIHAGDAAAEKAQVDARSAYVDVAARDCHNDLGNRDLGGTTLAPGVYCFSSSARLTGELRLDAQSSANAVFIFKIGASLDIANGARVSIINGGSPCLLFWQAGGSVSIGSGSRVAGNFLVKDSVTFASGAKLSGRVLVQDGSVSLDNNVITNAACAGARACPMKRSTPANGTEWCG